MTTWRLAGLLALAVVVVAAAVELAGHREAEQLLADLEAWGAGDE